MRKFSPRINAHGRMPLHIGNTSREFGKLPKPISSPKKGLRELLRNTQTYAPQISAYLESHPFETYESINNNKRPTLHLEIFESGSSKLSLGEIVNGEYTETLDYSFSVPKGIDFLMVFREEEKALGRQDLIWMLNCIVVDKSRITKK